MGRERDLGRERMGRQEGRRRMEEGGREGCIDTKAEVYTETLLLI